MPKVGTDWQFPGIMVRIIDGDTAYVRCDLGFYIERLDRFRLLGSQGGVNAYEMHDKDPVKRALALKGAARFNEMAPPGSSVLVVSDKAPAQEGFGRWLCQIVTADGQNVGDVLLAEGLAVPYVKG